MIVWEDSPGFCQEIEVRSHVSEWPKVNQLWSSQHLLWRRTACSPSSFYSLTMMKCVHCTKCSFSPKPYHVFFFPLRMFFPGLFTKLRPIYYSRLSSSFLVVKYISLLKYILQSSLGRLSVFYCRTSLCCHGLFTIRYFKAGKFVCSFISSS